MKIHTRVVLNWDGDTLEDEFFEYSGPVSFCGGSSGGGGSSGTVDYPDYMKDAHKQMIEEMNVLLPAPNPFVAVNAPAITSLTQNTAVSSLLTYLEGRKTQIESIAFSPSISITHQSETVHATLASTVSDVLGYLDAAFKVQIPSNLTALTAVLADRATELANLTNVEGSFDLESEVYPRFSAGMRSINAVQMSTFIIGRGTIEGTYLAKFAAQREALKQEVVKLQMELAQLITAAEVDVAKTNQVWIGSVYQLVSGLLQVSANTAAGFDTLRMQAASAVEAMEFEVVKLKNSLLGQYDSLRDSWASKSIEHSRMSVVALFEQSNINIDYDEKQYRWDLENYQYLGNMLAAIGSGTVNPGGRQTSKFSSALGGALSGASAGAMVGGGPVGAAIGGIIGLGAGLLG